MRENTQRATFSLFTAQSASIPETETGFVNRTKKQKKPEQLNNKLKRVPELAGKRLTLCKIHS